MKLRRIGKKELQGVPRVRTFRELAAQPVGQTVALMDFAVDCEALLVRVLPPPGGRGGASFRVLGICEPRRPEGSKP